MKVSNNTAFFTASLMYILTFATAGAPISVFNIYREDYGVTHADLGTVSLAYFLAAATALLVFGRVSNHVGRKPMIILTGLCAMISCTSLINIEGTPLLFIARMFQGFACGIASSSIATYVVDTGEKQPRWLVASVTSTSPMMGIPLGAISSGALATWGPAPKTLIFEIIFALMLICSLILAFGPETRQRQPGVLGSLKPKLFVPEGRGWGMTTAVGVLVATWSIGGFYQAFGPSIVAEELGTTSAIVSALAFSSVMCLTPLGGPLGGKISPRVAVKVGMVIYVIAVLSIIAALTSSNLIVFLVSSLFVGIAQGIATTACVKALLSGIAKDHRATLLATIFVISYSGAVFPAMAASWAAIHYSVFQICVGYVALGLVFATIAFFASGKMKVEEPAQTDQ